MKNATKPQRPSISVVMPAHNEAAGIARCLDALAAQTVQPDEIIVVDNNSTDQTAAIAATYKKVRVVKETAKGVTRARARGYDEAKSDIIARIDADVIVAPNWVETIVETFRLNPEVDALAGPAAVADLSPGGTFLFFWPNKLFRRWHNFSMGCGPFMYGYNCAFRQKVWHTVRHQLEDDAHIIADDVDLSLATLKHGFTIRYVPGMKVKTLWFRSANYQKVQNFYRGDNFGLHKYQLGNRRRQRKGAALGPNHSRH